jgi:hypothetical protein
MLRLVERVRFDFARSIWLACFSRESRHLAYMGWHDGDACLLFETWSLRFPPPTWRSLQRTPYDLPLVSVGFVHRTRDMTREWPNTTRANPMVLEEARHSPDRTGSLAHRFLSEADCDEAAKE